MNYNPIAQPLLYIYIVIIYRNRNIIQSGNYFLRRYANTTNTANMMMTIMCIGMPNKGYSDYLFRKKNLTLISIQIAVKIYSSKSLNGALMWIGK